MGIGGLEVQKEPLKAQTEPEGQGAEERPCSRELGVLLLHPGVDIFIPPWSVIPWNHVYPLSSPGLHLSRHSGPPSAKAIIWHNIVAQNMMA